MWTLVRETILVVHVLESMIAEGGDGGGSRGASLRGDVRNPILDYTSHSALSLDRRRNWNAGTALGRDEERGPLTLSGQVVRGRAAGRNFLLGSASHCHRTSLSNWVKLVTNSQTAYIVLSNLMLSRWRKKGLLKESDVWDLHFPLARVFGKQCSNALMLISFPLCELPGGASEEANTWSFCRQLRCWTVARRLDLFA
jgi:hypothetical protein